MTLKVIIIYWFYLFVEIKEAENEMREYIKSFMSEVERIEAFYLKMCAEYKHDFDVLNKRYM